MNKIYLLLFFLFNYSLAIAQTPNWIWAKSAPSAGVGEGWSIATDNASNVFITGYYFGSITFGSFTLSATEGVYLAKYDPNGNVKWAVSSTGGSGYAYSVATDLSGNSYITGFFNTTIIFGTYVLNCVGNNDIFFVKYDSTGAVVWAKSFGYSGDDKGYSVVTDNLGNVYLTGIFNSPSITFGSYLLTNPGLFNIFVVKYNSSGTVIWAKKGGGLSATYAYGIAIDAAANVYVTGLYVSSITFGSYTLSNAGGDDIFIAKFDSSGNVQWAKGMGGTTTDIGVHVATDGSNNVYMTGYFLSPTINFGSYTLTSTGNYDAFLAKLDPAGNVIWAKNIGGTGAEYGWCVATDKYNKVYITAYFASPTLMLDTITILKPTTGNDPMIVACYDSSGNALFGKALASGGDDANAVAVAPSGCVYVGGDFELNPFIVGDDTLIQSTGVENVFISQLCFSAAVANFSSSDSAVCSEGNNCINFFDNSMGNPTSWQWSFQGANPATSTQQNPTSICYNTPGTYSVSLIVGNSSGYDTLTVSPMIIVGNTPAPPVITVGGGDTLFSSHGDSYQWYLNGSPITGATDSFYVALQQGTYAVMITDGLGCSAQSAGMAVAINELSDALGIKISPNPVEGKLTVCGLIFAAIAEMKFYNLVGEIVYEKQVHVPNSKIQTTIDVSAVNAGIYFLQVSDGHKVYRVKLVKQ